MVSSVFSAHTEVIKKNLLFWIRILFVFCSFFYYENMILNIVRKVPQSYFAFTL